MMEEWNDGEHGLVLPNIPVFQHFSIPMFNLREDENDGQ
jgi:hypothetical protein